MIILFLVVINSDAKFEEILVDSHVPIISVKFSVLRCLKFIYVADQAKGKFLKEFTRQRGRK